MLVRPAMMTVELIKRQEAELEVAELTMLRLSQTRMDKIQNKYIIVRQNIWKHYSVAIKIIL